ncbi:hypothetical protein [Ureibacillus sp. FSL W8-0352]|uniref:hypothetical protein n=1 Tax=Ureibacillus sp. FSL W8-0352 TaxID=2954596 RepID=UPI0030F7BD44
MAVEKLNIVPVNLESDSDSIPPLTIRGPLKNKELSIQVEKQFARARCFSNPAMELTTRLNEYRIDIWSGSK